MSLTGERILSTIPDLLNALVTGLIGALIANRRSRNPIGWILLMIGLALAAGTSTNSYAILGALRGFAVVPGSVLVLWLSQLPWLFIFLGIILLLYLFPTGQPLTARWRIVMLVCICANVGLMVFFSLLSPLEIETPQGMMVQVANPVGLIPLENDEALFVLIFVILLVPLVLGLTAMVIRFVRARGVERQQMKWFLYAAALFILIFTLGANSPVADTMVTLVALGMPGAVGIALFRYRLFDIDILIRRTITYALVTALLLFIYFGSVIVLQQIVSSVTGSAQNEIVTVLSTLAIAALFVPLRNRVQSEIDKYFNRKKYDAQQVLNDFAKTVRDETDLEQLTARLIQVVDETMQPKSISVWLKREDKRIREGR
jgi:hypothetical protein